MSTASPTISFDDCAFKPKRAQLADFLTEYLLEEKGGFVLNLNGAWGVGKSHFLKCWEHELSKNYPVVRIDAWKTDFADDPLLVVVNSIIDFLKIGSGGETHETEKKVMQAAYKLLKPALKKAVTVVSGLAGVDTDVAGDTFEALEEVVSGAEKHFENFRNQVGALEEFQENILEWASCYRSTNGYEDDQPIFVFVDEVDRCRPNYAIELLETVKHMFELPNFIFVIATDSGQLQHSIKAVYGSGFDSAQYLTRFFDRSFQLPEPNIYQYLTATKEEEIGGLLTNCHIEPLSNQQPEQVKLLISNMATAYGLELRDIDKLIAKLVACFRHIARAERMSVVINLVCLISGIILHQRDQDAYERLPNVPNKQAVLKRDSIKASWLNNEDLVIENVVSTSFSYTVQLGEYREQVNSNREYSDRYQKLRKRLGEQVNGSSWISLWIRIAMNPDYVFVDWEYLRDLIEMSGSFDS